MVLVLHARSNVPLLIFYLTIPMQEGLYLCGKEIYFKLLTMKNLVVVLQLMSISETCEGA